jgi:dTDP-6-deoxy-L-talose 4-dehydrogenase (NAD+)
MNRKLKIVVVGGNSSIGQDLLSQLKNKNVKIIPTYKSIKNIKNKYNLYWKKLDIRKNKKNFFSYLEYPDIVVNLAWPDIPNYKTKKHFSTYKIQKRFVSNLVKNGLKNFIGIGTCYEYGKIKGKVSEDYKPKPIIPYAQAKLNLLKSIQALKINYSFKYTWLRPFFVYGKNNKRKTLFTLIKDLDNNKIQKLEVSGNLVRDFISTKYFNMILTKIILFNKEYKVLNICTGKGITVKEFIKKNLKNKKNIKKINLKGKNKNDFEGKSFWGDNRKLNQILKFK